MTVLDVTRAKRPHSAAGDTGEPGAAGDTSAPGTTGALSVPRGVALYVGALFGPGLLMLPGLAAKIAGPASVVAWAGLLAVSALFALVFTTLGTRFPDGGGVIAYTAAGLGRRTGRAVGWCFLTAVVLGAPVVCLIGAGYVTALTGGGRGATALVAAVLLAAVTVLTTAGARAGTAVQMVLVGLLLAVVVVAVAGSLPHARASHWTPFAPHGWTAVGSAASVLMLSFVGWEAAAPLTRRLADPARSLPRITGIAFAVTAIVYLALAVAVVAVLGAGAAGTVPAADLLRVAVGSGGPAIAAGAAVLLTLAAVNAYMTGAAALVTHLRAERQPQPQQSPETARAAQGTSTRGFFAWIALAGCVELTAEAFGLVDATRMITLTTALFLVVYVASMASATRVLTGRTRLAAAIACAASMAVLGFAGISALLACLAGIGGMLAQRSRRSPSAVVDDAVDAPGHGGQHADEAEPRGQSGAHVPRRLDDGLRAGLLAGAGRQDP
ncbi:amino acid efflux transporter [Catenulispora sp. GP43]|uniref:APC family permease n=1 Tax=Catenulispora sp. GP43 TaxID=3156263 RepID=UPI003514F0C7